LVTYPWGGESVSDTLPVVGAVTGILGTIALAWRLVDEFGSFLRISVKAEDEKDGFITILTTVENKGFRAKKISYSTILVCPENEKPGIAAKLLADAVGYQGEFKDLNSLESFVVVKAVGFEDRLLIPVSFYYEENVDISDETLSYRVPIPVGNFKSKTAYAVRFFVYGPRIIPLFGSRLYRSTADTFINK
jgi:hypothetical protein